MLSLTKIAVPFIFYVYCKAVEECKDAYPRCKEEKINCTQPVAHIVCASTCGFCGTTTTVATTATTANGCVDRYPQVCPDYVKNNCTSPLAAIACELSCKYCGTSSGSTSPAPTSRVPTSAVPLYCPEECKFLAPLCHILQWLFGLRFSSVCDPCQDCMPSMA